MKSLVPFALVCLLSCGKANPPIPSWGMDVAFTVRAKQGETTPETINRAAEVVVRRLTLLGFPHTQITSSGGNRISLRVPGATTGNIGTVTIAFGSMSDLRAHEPADAKTQTSFNQSGNVPPGYFACEAKSKIILMKKEDVLQGAQITNAWAEPSGSGGPPALWQTGFQLSSDGAARLETVLDRLSKQQPPGLLAFILDGKVKSLTQVTTLPGGRVARIQGGASEAEANELALILLSGALESDLGSDVSGEFIPRTTISHSYYGTAPPQSAPK